MLRLEADPLRYRELITWAEQPTLHGTGRPMLEEALFESWVTDFDEPGYFSFLDELISRLRTEGRIEDAETWSHRKAEAEELWNKIGEMTRRSLQGHL